MYVDIDLPSGVTVILVQVCRFRKFGCYVKILGEYNREMLPSCLLEKYGQFFRAILVYTRGSLRCPLGRTGFILLPAGLCVQY